MAGRILGKAIPAAFLIGLRESFFVQKEVTQMDASPILSGLPRGLAQALADDSAAFNRFLALPTEGKRALIRQSRNVHSKEEMQALATSLHV